MMEHDPWSEIGAAADLIVGRRVQGEHLLDVFWIKDPDGTPGLLFRALDSDHIPNELPKPKGILLEASVSSEKNEFRMRLKEPEARDVFTSLCRDVISYSGNGANRADATYSIFRRLRHWQAMLSRGHTFAMDKCEVRGLIGELIVLERLSAKVGFESAFRAWVAPEDHPQDFADGDRLIEVKARLSSSRKAVYISSFNQLEMTALPLYLVVVELVSGISSDSFNLNQMCDRMTEVARDAGGNLMDDLEEALFSRGYIKMDEYNSDRYKVSDISCYECREDFPRLMRSKVDSRISSGQYVVDLSLLGSFEVSGELLFS